MKMLLRLCAMIALGVVFRGNLCAATPHWSCDIYSYQYDMSVYCSLVIGGIDVGNLSDYEIAAFCGDECRGVGNVMTAEKDGQTTTYCYLRIRSNQQEGETISFKVYQKSVAKEVDIYQTTIEFQSQQLVGLPSSPLQLRMVQKGDVNGDGQVDTQDAIKVIQYYLGKNPDDFVLGAADVTDDGVVDTQDAIQIIRTYLNK